MTESTGSAVCEWEHAACPLCDERDSRLIVQASDPLTGRAGPFRVVRCVGCTMAYTNPRPTASAMADYYPPNYFPHQGHIWEDARKARWKRRLERSVLRCRFAHPPQPVNWQDRVASVLGRLWIRRARQRFAWIPYSGSGRLLDFGCGASRFMRRMHELGWEVHGLDTPEAMARIRDRHAGVTLHAGSLPHPDVAPESLDVITMWDALEHVPDPRQVLRSAYEALTRGGLLVIGLPNFDGWTARRFGASWYGLDLPRHLSHFGPGTLRAMLERERFQLCQVQQVARPSWVRRSARRAHGRPGRSSLLRVLRIPPAASTVARWCQFTGQADYLHVRARKV